MAESLQSPPDIIGNEDTQPSVSHNRRGSGVALTGRNERALQFLTSITTSNVVDAGSRAAHNAAHNNSDGIRFNFDPQRILGHDNVVNSVGSGVAADAQQKNSGQILRFDNGEAALSGEYTNADSNDADASGGLVDFGFQRRISYSQTDYTDVRNCHHPTEFVMMKPSSFPMVFASIKPFNGKGDDKYRYGASAVSDGERKYGITINKKDLSFAHLLHPLRTIAPEAEHDSGGAMGNAYQPNRLDDPGLHKGLQRTVLGLTGYMGTIFEYTRPDDLRQELNDHFRETHPELYAAGLTLDQIRRLRAHMLRVTREQDLELSTAAIGWVYFEKLIWKGYVAKDNRKLVAAAKHLFLDHFNLYLPSLVSADGANAIQRRFEVSSKSILDQEFSVFAELDFSLWVPRREFMPHFLRMFEVLGLYRSLADYLGDSDFFA